MGGSFGAAMLCASLALLVAPALAHVVAPQPSTRLIALVAGTAVLCGAASGFAVGWSPELAAYAVLSLGCAVLAVIDARTHRLPNRITGPLAIGLVALLLVAALADRAGAQWLRAVICGGATLAGLGAVAAAFPAGIGLGDVKLAGILSVALGWLGWEAVPIGLFAGFAVGALVSLVLLLARRATLRSEIPFGPSLIAGALGVCAAWPL
jgi:leader peptidase (prepilin peptidase)/N-methyltransferase